MIIKDRKNTFIKKKIKRHNVANISESGESTLSPTSVIGIRSKFDSRTPMSVLLCVMTAFAVICMAQMLAVSFLLFGVNSAEPVRIYFTSPEIARFWFFAFVGCLLICGANAVHRHSVKATTALLALYIFVFFRHYNYVIDGFVHAANKVTYSVLTAAGSYPRQYYITFFDLNEPKAELLWFMYACIFGACFLLSYFGIRRCSSLWFSLLVLSGAAVPLAFNCLDGEIWFVLAVTVCILMYTIDVQGYRRADRDSTVTSFGSALRIHGKYTAYSAFQQTFMMALSTALVIFCINTFADFSDYQKDPRADKLGRDILYTIEDITSGTFFERFGLGTANGLNKGQLNSLGDLDYTGETMFEIKSGAESTLYLRSYSASEYTGKRWAPVSNKTYRSYDFWDKFRENGFFPQFVFSENTVQHIETAEGGSSEVHLMQGFDSAGGTFPLEIKNREINHKTFLTDYRMLPDMTEDALGEASYKYDGNFTFDRFGGTDSYTQTLLADDPNTSFSVYFGGLPESGSTPERLYSILHDGQFEEMASMISDYYIESEEPYDLKEYESEYRRYVLENYTEYPDNIGEYLPYDFDSIVDAYYEECIEIYPDSEDAVFRTDRYYNAVSEYIRGYLSSSATYTLTPGRTPSGRDFIEYFINENHEGYCVHFATAAAVMLRRAGIPARYCEGFFVSSSAFTENHSSSNGFVKVPDSSAHAWVEVYYPMLGWKPVEFTPYYSQGELPEENKPDTSSDSDTDSQTDSDSQTDTDTETDTETDSQTDTDSGSDSDSEPQSDTDNAVAQYINPEIKKPSKLLAALVSILKTLFVIVLLIVLWLGARYVVCLIRKRRFEGADTRKAAVALYVYALRIMKLMGVSKQMGEGDEAFAKRASRESHEIGSREMSEFTETVLCARFGKDAPTREKIDKMRVFVSALLNSLYGTVPKWKKLIIKYIFFYD